MNFPELFGWLSIIFYFIWFFIYHSSEKNSSKKEWVISWQHYIFH